MNKHLFLGILYLFHFVSAIGQNSKTIEGQLVGEDGEVVPYATILSIDPVIYGGVSTLSGKFSIPIIHDSDSVLPFFISCLGYKDTVVILSTRNRINEIRLTNKIELMPELIIEAPKMTRIAFGSRSYPFPAMADSSLLKMSLQSIGNSVGNMYKIDGSNYILESASFYIDNPTDIERTYLVNLYESFVKKYKYFFLNNRAELEKKVDKNILFSVRESGWYEVQLLDYGITLKKKSNFFVSVTDVTSTKQGDDFEAETIDLVMQNNRDPKTYQFVTMSDKFSILKSKGRKFAIVLNLLTE